MKLTPEQHEVKGRFYIIEPTLSETGYAVEVRRVGQAKLLWRCAVDFVTDLAMGDIYGDSIRTMIDLAKHDLNHGFIRESQESN